MRDWEPSDTMASDEVDGETSVVAKIVPYGYEGACIESLMRLPIER
jgi:hypothetical protein